MKGRERRPLHMVHVQLLKTEDSKKIFQINRIDRVIVTVEKLRKRKGATQCFNCQQFHHASSTCYKKTVCLKCSGPHRASQCPKKHWGKDTRCANCGGEHVANYRGCPMYPKPRSGYYQETRSRQQETLPRHPRQEIRRCCS